MLVQMQGHGEGEERRMRGREEEDRRRKAAKAATTNEPIDRWEGTALSIALARQHVYTRWTAVPIE